MENWKFILDKKPWLLEYYYPSSGSRYTALLYMYAGQQEPQPQQS